MPRRVTLPGASELFRRTEAPPAAQPGAAPTSRTPLAGSPSTERPAPQTDSASAVPLAPEPTAHSGRVRHDEKMTVYVSPAELVALEQARLTLRAEHGLKVDRGRIVRAAVSMALADLAQGGADSELARQLRAQ